MNFLKQNRRFSFLYDGKPIDEQEYSVSSTENGVELITTYTFECGLVVTNIARKIEKFGAYEWVNYFENTSDTTTKIITDIFDADIELPFEKDAPRPYTAHLPNKENVMKIAVPRGSDCTAFDFFADADDEKNVYTFPHHIFGDSIKEYKTSGGRSSNREYAPFFNVNRQGIGFIAAIGWTGQWNAKFTRTDTGLLIQTKIEDTHFVLYPGEKIRTSSFVIMPYKGEIIDAQNTWRRLVREEFSLIGNPGRASHLPFCSGVWGGMHTDDTLERLDKIDKFKLPFEYIWMDAGWYGMSPLQSPDEYEGEWSSTTGDWRVNPYRHPDGLLDISKKIYDIGKEFLLWFEPERVPYTSPIYSEHPEYFIESPIIGDRNRLLNLGDPNAWNYCFKTICDIIEKLNVHWYRQDFNIEPLEFWRRNDAPNRRGITEIKHIMGLYRFWDAMLEKFPNINIDNCASGGRRIDIETLKRSAPLWRSDAQCPANYPPEYSQNHNVSYSLWMPYSCTSPGRRYDEYALRSAYAPGMSTNYAYSARDAFGDDPEKIAFIDKYFNEYLKVRPYFNGDLYPLTKITDRYDTWLAVQYNLPEEQKGIVQVFRREESPYEMASFTLRGIDENKIYTFTDADDNSESILLGEELLKNGFSVTVKEKRKAKIYFYKVN